jgi:ABC-type multidrug transport system permease subunit
MTASTDDSLGADDNHLAGPLPGPAPSPTLTVERVAALLRGEPTVPTTGKTLFAMLARDMRVMRRNYLPVLMRAILQPLLFVFVFTYVMPKVRGGSLFSEAGITFSTILVPGLIASVVLTQGMVASSAPLLLELSFERSIEDRVLSPVAVWLLGLEKIVAAAIQGLIATCLAFPIVLLVHSAGQAPHIHLTNWPLFLLIMISGALLFAALGMLLSTLMEPQQMQMLFTVILLPLTMLGCLYYPWSSLRSVRWLQIAVLFNPMVYLTEGLRSVLTPQIGHMPTWAFLLALVGGAVVVAVAAARSFVWRVLS